MIYSAPFNVKHLHVSLVDFQESPENTWLPQFPRAHTCIVFHAFDTANIFAEAQKALRFQIYLARIHYAFGFGAGCKGWSKFNAECLGQMYEKQE